MTRSLLPFVLVCLSFVASGETTVIRIDAGPGALVRARDSVRALKARFGGALPGPVEVVFSDGICPVDAVVGFDASDSGTEETPIVYRASSKGRTVFDGGIRLNWRSPLSGDVRLCLIPASVRKNIRVADIPEILARFDFRGSRTQRNGYPFWLYAGRKPLPVAAWPNAAEDWDKVGADLAVVDGTTRDLEGSNKAAKDIVRFRVWESDRLKSWAQEPDLWAYGLWGFEWDDGHAPVRDIDIETRTVSLDQEFVCYPPGENSSYRMVNAFCELDTEGEWAVDRSSRRVYAWLPEGGVIMSSSESAIRAQNLSFVEFRGLGFLHLRGDALVFENATSVVVRTCAVRAVGGYGVVFSGCRDCLLEGCDLMHLGEGGVMMTGGDPVTLTPGRNAAVNNHISWYGERLAYYRAGITCGPSGGHKWLPSVGNRAEHNLIHHSRHMGIGFYGNCDMIASNVVHDTCAWTLDAGAIYGYTQDSWTSLRGTVIEGNCVYFTGKHESPYLNNGIYVDGISSGVIVRGNIVVRATSGLFLTGGRSTVWVNNLVVLAQTPLSGGDLGYTRYHTQRDSVAWRALQKNRELYHRPPWSNRFPDVMRQCDSGDPLWAQCALYSVWTNNVTAASGRSTFVTKNLRGTETITNNIALADDPGFEDYASLNLNLRPDSPVRRVAGDLSFADMGLVDSPMRFSPAVKFGKGVTAPPPLTSRLYAAAQVRVDVVAPGKWSDERPFATNLVGCSMAPSWCSERNRIDTYYGVANQDGRWIDYHFSFVPTSDMTCELVFMGVWGKKTCYDALKVTGAEIAEDGCEDPTAWSHPTPHPTAIETMRSDISEPFGVVPSIGKNRAFSGSGMVVANGDLHVGQKMTVRAGVPVTISFKATAWR